MQDDMDDRNACLLVLTLINYCFLLKGAQPTNIQSVQLISKLSINSTSVLNTTLVSLPRTGRATDRSMYLSSSITNKFIKFNADNRYPTWATRAEQAGALTDLERMMQRAATEKGA